MRLLLPRNSAASTPPRRSRTRPGRRCARPSNGTGSESRPVTWRRCVSGRSTPPASALGGQPPRAWTRCLQPSTLAPSRPAHDHRPSCMPGSAARSSTPPWVPTWWSSCTAKPHPPAHRPRLGDHPTGDRHHRLASQRASRPDRRHTDRADRTSRPSNPGSGGWRPMPAELHPTADSDPRLGPTARHLLVGDAGGARSSATRDRMGRPHSTRGGDGAGQPPRRTTAPHGSPASRPPPRAAIAWLRQMGILDRRRMLVIGSREQATQACDDVAWSRSMRALAACFAQAGRWPTMARKVPPRAGTTWTPAKPTARARSATCSGSRTPPPHKRLRSRDSAASRSSPAALIAGMFNQPPGRSARHTLASRNPGTCRRVATTSER